MEPNSKSRDRFMVVLLTLVAAGMISPRANGQARRVPVIYCTDLFHPHDDPDDHFDIACLYAMDEIEIKAVILDQGKKQQQRPGAIPVSQLNHITARRVPHAIGLSDELRDPQDKGLDQPEDYQNAVSLILTTLKESTEPVTIITVGSLRDVAAAFNRSPDLFSSKVGRLFIFIGEASAGDHVEYNVGLDKNAYIRIMNSGLPVYWVPCFDGGLWKNNGRASYWRAPHRRLLSGSSDRVMNYFIYAMLRKTEPDPVRFLENDSDSQDRRQVLSMNRNLWCTAVFPCIAGRKYVRTDRGYACLAAEPSRKKRQREIKPFEFVDTPIFVDKQAEIHYDRSNSAGRIKQFRILNSAEYADIMTSVTAQLLGQLGR